MGTHLSTSNSELKQLIVKMLMGLILFMVVSFLVYYPINHMYFNSFGGNSGAQINQTLRMKSDVFIFGASRASHHYDPEIISNVTGLSVFNAGDDGKNAVYQLGLLNLLLDNHVPEIIIYEVGDIGHGFDGGTVDLFPYYYGNYKIKDILNDRDFWAPIKFLVPLYAYNRKVLSIMKGYFLKTPPFKNGFRPIYGEMHKMVEKMLREESKKQVSEISASSYNDFAVRSFEQFVQTCSNNGIELFFVYSPTYIPKAIPGGPTIEKLSREFHIPLYNYGISDTFNWNTKYFKDAGHMNAYGADVFSRDLACKIKSQINVENLR